jgi:RNA polymerase sigma factor (sigma-70 family)
MVNSLSLSTADALVALTGTDAGSAWTTLVERHGAEVWRLIASRVRHLQEAEDAYQDFWTSLPTAATRFKVSTSDDVERSARAWLMRVAYVTAIDRRRPGRVPRGVSLISLQAQEGTMDRVGEEVSRQRAPEPLFLGRDREEFEPKDQQEQILGRMHEALGDLPEGYRRPLLLHIVGGLSYEELAADLRCTVGNARVKVHRGLKRLRELLGGNASSMSDRALGGLLVPLLPALPSLPSVPLPIDIASAAIAHGTAVSGSATGLGLAAKVAIVGSLLTAAATGAAVLNYTPAKSPAHVENTAPISISTPTPATPAATFPAPLFEFTFDHVQGTTVANTGTTAATIPNGYLSPVWPQSRSNVPDGIPGGLNKASLDFGVDKQPYAVEIPGGGTALMSLRSFTISGWLNNHAPDEILGGNRIVCWHEHGSGVDLALRDHGRLQLGVNAWADQSENGMSTAGMIPASATSAPENWRFFAVTYDSTLSASQISYYVGTPGQRVRLDATANCTVGPVGLKPSPGLTIGHVSADERTRNLLSVFRGLIDHIRIWGSTTDGSGALTVEQLDAVQHENRSR